MTDIHKLINDNIPVWTNAVQFGSNRGRGRSKKLTLHGVKKLRDLILELAVHGKLVPQSPTDEPASILLERIAIEKKELIKQKLIKKPKNLPELTNEDLPYSVPNSWTWCRLQDVSSYIQRGKGPKYDDAGKVKVISQKCIQWSGFDITPARFVNDESIEKYQDERFLQPNDLLWNSTGTGTVGRINVLEEVQEKTLVADSHVTIIRTQLPNPQFIWIYISAPGIQARIEPEHENALVSGSTKQVELNTSSIVALEVPIPPLEEQQRIVYKVNELMVLCDQLEQQTEASIDAHQLLVEELLSTLFLSAEGTSIPAEGSSENAQAFEQNWARIAQHFDLLFTTEHSIEQLKQTILQLAVMGKLVPQNAEHIPASVLIKEVAETKQSLIKEKFIKKQSFKINFAEEKPSVPLPSNWEWSSISELAEINPRNEAEDDSMASFIPMPLISKSYKGDHGQESRSWSEIKTGYTHFSDGDLALAKITPCFENSKAAVFNNLKNGVGAGTTELHVARFIDKRINPLYALLFIKTPLFLETGKRHMTGSAGQKRVPKDFFATYPMPLPPAEEQALIVDKVDSLMSLCDQMKKLLSVASKIQVDLSEAIVASALK